MNATADREYDQREPDFVEAEFDRVEANDKPASRALIPTYDIVQMPSDYYVRKPVSLPRNLVEVDRNLMIEADLAGDDFYYAWGKGKDRVEGGTIILAMAMARCWGNCAAPMMPLQETHDAFVFTSRFIDLESGTTIDRQFRQSKRSTVHGKFDAARKEDMRFSVGQSKAARNVILKALPEWLKNKAIEQAKKGVRKRLETLIAEEGIAKAQDILVEAFRKEGVPTPRILDYYDIAKVDALDVDKLVELRGMLRAIQNGEERADNLFPPTEAETVEDQKKKAKSNLDSIAQQMTGDDLAHPGRRGGNGSAKPSGQQKTEVTTVATEQPKQTAPVTQPTQQQPTEPATDVLAMLRTLLTACPSIEALDKAFKAFAEANRMTDAQFVAAEALYGEQHDRINGRGVVAGAKTETLPTGPSQTAQEFVKQFPNSRTTAGVNRIMARATEQGFQGVDLEFIKAKGTERLAELERK